MVQLIITLFAIGLTAALAVASINYLPWWRSTAADTAATLKSTLVLLEQGYDVAVRARDGLAPPITPAVDGGLAEGFLPILRFTPPAPPGYAWVYGKYAGTDPSYAELNYFCLTPAEPGAGLSEGIYRGIARTMPQFSADQLFVSDECGATSSTGTPMEYPYAGHLTFYVMYSPGISH